MDVIERLTKQGKDLGYEGETLQTFVKEQQIELRDERKAMREAERERREAENAKHEAEAKLERERREADAKLEREKLELMERIEAQKRKIEKEAREAVREAREAETAKREAEAKIEHDKREAEAKMERDKREAEELFKREELETMERIEREKHDIEREKIEAAEKQREAAERQRKEEREAAERHDQLLCDMEKAKLALEQDKINSQQFQQQRDYEFKCQLQDRQHEGELERSEAQKALTQPRETIKAKAPKISAFNEGKDEMDSYLLRFERYATAQKWEPDTWATGLSALLQGKALDVYALMPKEDALNYDKLKVALLKRYELTEEGFKRKYKKCRPENGETFQQFTTRMKSYFTRWIDMASIEKSYEGLQDLILREQLTFICNRDLELFLREREPKSLEQASKLADQYKEARYVDIVSLTYKNNERSRSRSNSESRSRSRSPTSRGPNQGNQGYPRPRVRCYNCGGPHVRRFCPQLKQGIMKAGAVDYRRSRSPTRKVTFQTQEPEVPKEETAKDGNQNTEPKVCGACLFLTDAVNYSQATTNEREMLKTSVGSPIKVSSVSSLSEMSTVQGFVICSGVIVSKDLVPESAYTGRSQTMVMVDYSSRVVPEVKVSIDTPYYKGEVLALCVEKPLVGLFIGNKPGARERNNPDINWVPALAVQTRAQAKREGVTSKLKTPSIIDRTITPAQVSKAQKDDVSLTTTRSRCEANETIGKATFLKKNDLLYRKFSSPNVEHGRTFTQLIVPQQYRTLVMKLAHESVMAGHLAIKRTMQKVLSEFYWPGINSDIKSFCQSCDICQRTIPKGKIVKAPLGKMPRIDVPFRRVATDLIGPLKPVTYNKNRYILTLVDYATRYPEAVPLASIDTETVAEALVSIFSRVGIPHEVLTDMGTQYTSAVMKEVSRLLSFKQLVTTPYHPICNGLVERFNQTIKKMLMRMCAERPKDWDKYIDPLLFAYREAPQESLGFSPFELLYGWPVRGPMQIIKQLWSKEIEDPEVRSTYQYVIELRDRLESTLEIAQDNLSKMSRKYKRHYDQKAGKRQLKIGDKALVLLPTDKNKLLMGWKGPYEVVEKLSPLDYRIRISGKEKKLSY